jgi:hypothetical protein
MNGGSGQGEPFSEYLRPESGSPSTLQ